MYKEKNKKINLDINHFLINKKLSADRQKNMEKKIKLLKENYLNKKNYYIILKNLGKNKKDIKAKTIKFANTFGTMISQNIDEKKIVSVKPNVHKLKKFKKDNAKKKLRYHQTNLGGSIHSDGPQLIQPPNYVLMTCLNQSSEGGDSIIVNTKKIFQNLKKNKPKILRTLKEKFLFDQRGFYKKKFKVLNKPIFQNTSKDIKFRYLRDYILSGYELKKKSLSLKKKQAMSCLDEMLSSKKFQIKYKLKIGEMIIINNNVLAHGRTGFSIKNKQNLREILRIWLKN